MKENKKGFQMLIAHWIKWDGTLWAELRDIQMRLLYDRLVKEVPLSEMASQHRVSVKQLRLILAAIFLKIEQSHGKSLADMIRSLNDAVESEDHSGVTFQIHKIWLN